MKGRTLIVVAHPDDETIFAFSQLIQSNCHVMCMTNQSHSIRSKEFDYLMTKLSIPYTMYDYPDIWDGSFPEIDVKKNIQNVLSQFDNVLTHNSDGEYGHTQHKVLYRIVNQLVDKNLYVFGKTSLLEFDVLLKKIDVLKTYYDSQYKLGTYNWYETNNPSNKIMNYIVQEGCIQIK